MSQDVIDPSVIDSIVICIQDTAGFGRRAFERFSLSTDVARALGIDGDDANELMVEFFERFSIDLNDYDPYRYFVEEGFSLWPCRRPKDRRGNIPLRIGMLHSALQARRWDTQAFEQLRFSDSPLYARTEDIPVQGYKIKRR
ncbi:DUF1493 family protein [Pseudomonas sp. RP23018S]|uniref:DUF1493 family protein n=1 Tax=Pseudomonas sp. RP23018S TaxID=3096037 RepID=UPI002ACAA26D|nr:DUF1493 family protein [Pseudomonas sp. RP23018S]MDZ5603153.1 DUF1493 family protein [Pseudomonas sp. RP23018S]